jgi:hypothetical protein
MVKCKCRGILYFVVSSLTSIQQVILALDGAIEVWDIRDGCKRLEVAPFFINNLISVPLKVDDKKVRSYERAISTYKGKVFLLVGPLHLVESLGSFFKGGQRYIGWHSAILDRSYSQFGGKGGHSFRN